LSINRFNSLATISARDPFWRILVLVGVAAFSDLSLFDFASSEMRRVRVGGGGATFGFKAPVPEEPSFCSTRLATCAHPVRSRVFAGYTAHLSAASGGAFEEALLATSD
jgi:hypothetical protein